jgi:hypothetical protein
VVRSWSWRRVVEELTRCTEEHRSLAAVGLLGAWSREEEVAGERKRAVLDYMEHSGAFLFTPDVPASDLLAVVGADVAVLRPYPGVAAHVAEALFRDPATAKSDLLRAAELCALALRAGDPAGEGALEALASNLSGRSKRLALGPELLRPLADLGDALERVLAQAASYFQPARVADVEAWFATFAVDRQLELPAETRWLILHKIAEVIAPLSIATGRGYATRCELGTPPLCRRPRRLLYTSG